MDEEKIKNDQVNGEYADGLEQPIGDFDDDNTEDDYGGLDDEDDQ